MCQTRKGYFREKQNFCCDGVICAGSRGVMGPAAVVAGIGREETFSRTERYLLWDAAGWAPGMICCVCCEGARVSRRFFCENSSFFFIQVRENVLFWVCPGGFFGLLGRVFFGVIGGLRAWVMLPIF
jgi:hypothetical protein